MGRARAHKFSGHSVDQDSLRNELRGLAVGLDDLRGIGLPTRAFTTADSLAETQVKAEELRVAVLKTLTVLRRITGG